MSSLAQIADVVDFIDECLATSDWDSLGALAIPPLTDIELEDPLEIHEALDAVNAMRQRVQQRMDEVAGELESVPAVRRASRAYLGKSG
jgi:hypothetical protein